MSAKLDECQDQFFKSVSVDDDIDIIKARGEANQKRDEELMNAGEEAQ